MTVPDCYQGQYLVSDEMHLALQALCRSIVKAKNIKMYELTYLYSDFSALFTCIMPDLVYKRAVLQC